MKTYEEREKETCEWCAKGWRLRRPASSHEHPTGGNWPFCTALSHEDYEAELRAEIAAIAEQCARIVDSCMTESAGLSVWNAALANAAARIRQYCRAGTAEANPNSTVEVWKAAAETFGGDHTIARMDAAESSERAFHCVATVIQGAYVSGQLPRPSYAKLADLIIAEYSSKRASAYEQGKRADVLEAKLRIAVGIIDAAPHCYCQAQTEPHCQHCRKPRARHYWDSKWSADGTCKDDRGRPETTKWTPLDPLPCDCWKSRAVEALADASPQPESGK